MRKIILVITIIITGILVFYLATSSETPVTDENFVYKGTDWENIIPRAIIKTDLEKDLGTPISSEFTSQGSRSTYRSPSATRNHEVIYDRDGKVIFTKEIITSENDRSVESIIDEYGEAEDFLYGIASSSGEFLYVYANQGIAYVGNNVSGVVREMWRFSPITFDEFKILWGAGYSADPEISNYQ